jgi:hypothetical protein
MTAARVEAKPWEQLPGESGPAHAAFLAYRDLGQCRSFAATARALGRHESLMRRWATRYRWRERARAWDLHETREQETVVRQQQETLLRERLADLDRMGRACLLFFRTLVRRDPETGEISFDVRFTPQIALRFLELALKAQGAFDRSPREDESQQQSPADLFGLADAELAELIDLARERADQHDQRKEGSHESETYHPQQEDEGENSRAERD